MQNLGYPIYLCCPIFLATQPISSAAASSVEHQNDVWHPGNIPECFLVPQPVLAWNTPECGLWSTDGPQPTVWELLSYLMQSSCLFQNFEAKRHILQSVFSSHHSNSIMERAVPVDLLSFCSFFTWQEGSLSFVWVIFSMLFNYIRICIKWSNFWIE